ncbi:hypothetical protein [Chitinophaga pinensis]|uniref:GAF domain-containing protein n=1 Tax=Chitinophaga pinensis (strain ATCC 43595 / DSM 2588 / LMG 13176 / NBRC 15968 / NCIMB 11800 / UQM 2034) TaxID=485918 RepID=A0A979G949_CHIPD|nr:hypothetical protein [Chitinophaga pinensis]ACU63239.1 hypothetical protein Cpin_5820 [Chitinophaga pinensis DSM 2588]
MVSWERKALTFISQTSEWDRRGDIRTFLSFGISLLRELTGAYMSLQLDFEDSYTARVTGATPSYLDDLIFNPGPMHQLLEKSGQRPLYWTQIPEKNAFEDLFQALSSAVIIPVRAGEVNALIVLGWSDIHACDSSFREFMDIVRTRIEEVCRHAHVEHTSDKVITRYTSILNTLSEALVFIGGDGKSGWINIAAAQLLQLEQPGEYAPAVLSGAMATLIQQALNKSEIAGLAMQAFASPASRVEHMIWKMSDRILDASCLPVEGKGKLWKIIRN